jgi:hypothetical protein
LLPRPDWEASLAILVGELNVVHRRATAATRLDLLAQPDAA